MVYNILIQSFFGPYPLSVDFLDTKTLHFGIWLCFSLQARCTQPIVPLRLSYSQSIDTPELWMSPVLRSLPIIFECYWGTQRLRMLSLRGPTS